MIITNDLNPKYSIYYLGAIILEILKNQKEIEIDELFNIVKAKIDDQLNIDYIYYSLDWLFLLNTIRLKENKVKLCY